MRTFRVYLTVILGAILTAGSLGLLLAFGMHDTRFLEVFGLPDPTSQDMLKTMPAAHWVADVILASAVVLLGVTLWSLISDVLLQANNSVSIRKRWRELRTDLAAGRIDRSEVLRDLRDRISNKARLSKVLQIWQEGNQGADASSELRSVSATPRQVLGVCHTLASVLVLIGLMGNFFGLVEAVTTLPRLVQVAGVESPTPTSTQTPHSSPHQLPNDTGVTVTDTTSSTESGNNESITPSNLGEPLDRIANSLKVVVVSSVIGILGMIVVLMFVAMVKGLLSELLDEEQALVSTELEPGLAPGRDASLYRDMRQLRDGLVDLPDTLKQLQIAATGLTEAVGQSHGDIKLVVQHLDALLEHQLVEAKNAYKGYQTSLTDFGRILADERGVTKTLAQAATGVYQNLERISERVKELNDQIVGIQSGQAEAQQEYQNYMRLVAELVKTEHQETHKVLTGASDHLREGVKDVAALSLTHMKQSGERLEAFLSKMETSQQAEAQRSSESLQALKTFGVDAAAQFKELATTLSDNATDAKAQLLETVRVKLQAMATDVSKKYEVAFREAIAAQLKDVDHIVVAVTNQLRQSDQLHQDVVGAIRDDQKAWTIASQDANRRFLEESLKSWKDVSQGARELMAEHTHAVRTEQQNLNTWLEANQKAVSNLSSVSEQVAQAGQFLVRLNTEDLPNLVGAIKRQQEQADILVRLFRETSDKEIATFRESVKATNDDYLGRMADLIRIIENIGERLNGYVALARQDGHSVGNRIGPQSSDRDLT